MSLILDLLFPRRCYSCGKIGKYFCASCFKNITPLPLDINTNKLCIFKYNDAVRRSITDIKYNFVTDSVAEITYLTAKTIKKTYPHLLKYWKSKKFVFISIPLHWTRRHWRSFNQSDLLASSIAQNLKLKYLPNLLLKTKNTRPQASFKHKISRTKNLNHAFEINKNLPAGRQVPQNLIIFDDVYTTGATLNSASSILKSHCHEIWFLTLAG